MRSRRAWPALLLPCFSHDCEVHVTFRLADAAQGFVVVTDTVLMGTLLHGACFQSPRSLFETWQLLVLRSMLLLPCSFSSFNSVELPREQPWVIMKEDISKPIKESVAIRIQLFCLCLLVSCQSVKLDFALPLINFFYKLKTENINVFVLLYPSGRVKTLLGVMPLVERPAWAISEPLTAVWRFNDI